MSGKSPSGALSPYYYKGGYFHGIHYGSYFDDHNVLVQVFPYGTQDDVSTYYVNDTMKAGEQRALVAQAQ